MVHHDNKNPIDIDCLLDSLYDNLDEVGIELVELDIDKVLKETE
jgi:hypothetical protein